LAASGCKRAGVTVSRTAYILGPTNDILPVKGDTVQRISPDVLGASALIATHMADNRIKYCSGTLIAGAKDGDNERILTNHHCFAVTDANDKATADLLPEACTETHVYFGFLQGHISDVVELGCQADSLHTSFDGDVAVFTLDQNPPDGHKPIQLWTGDDAPEGRTALIVHYPDVDANLVVPPDGGAQLPTAAATLDNCKVVGNFPVNEWDLDRTLAFSLRHTCDLIHGSSGSGLIDAETGQLLGVNWGGIKISYDDGERTDNVATKASFVAAFLAGQTDTLIKAAGQQKQQNAADAQRQERATRKSSGVSFADGIKRKACGTIGVGEDGAAAFLLGLLGLVAPLACLRKRRIG